MSYPNIPLGGPDWQRKATQAINRLLNEVEYYVFKIDGMPDAGQVIFDQEFPIPLVIDQGSCALRSYTAATAVSDIRFVLDGSDIGTGTILGGETDGSYAFTDTRIPADTRFQIIAPDPQDATLADIVLTLAVRE